MACIPRSPAPHKFHLYFAGTIRLLDREFMEMSQKFLRAWKKKNGSPKVISIFAVTNPTLKRQWDNYRKTLAPKKSEEHYHGTKLTCNITSSQGLCSDGNCGICGISSAGLDRQCIGRIIDFQRYGSGFYLAPNSSKCHDYTQGANGYRAMLLCDVLPGRRYNLQTNSQNLTGPPIGHDSVYGQVGDKLNYPEVVVYKPEAVLPRYIIVYQKDGTAHPLAS